MANWWSSQSSRTLRSITAIVAEGVAFGLDQRRCRAYGQHPQFGDRQVSGQDGVGPGVTHDQGSTGRDGVLAFRVSRGWIGEPMPAALAGCGRPSKTCRLRLVKVSRPMGVSSRSQASPTRRSRFCLGGLSHKPRRRSRSARYGSSETTRSTMPFSDRLRGGNNSARRYFPREGPRGSR